MYVYSRPYFTNYQFYPTAEKMNEINRELVIYAIVQTAILKQVLAYFTGIEQLTAKFTGPKLELITNPITVTCYS